MYHKPRRFSTNELYDLANVLSTNELFTQTCVKYVIRKIALFPKATDSSTRRFNNLDIPRKKIKLAQCQIKYTGPKLFNDFVNSKFATNLNITKPQKLITANVVKNWISHSPAIQKFLLLD